MKLLRVFIISFFIIIILSNNIFALGEVFNRANSWVDTGSQHTNTTIDTSDLKNVSNQLYNILIAIATVVAIIVGVILGMQYMTAGVEKKVEVKKSLFPYLISCIIVFGSVGIWRLVVVIMAKI